ncbi:VOC family protein [Pedobacter deserti]|uniref:VOC family protein n=1 Tax=Pedobacter deserti TaxID=2817382 RepID=UPI00210ACCB7|nr:VOC family protein [Pedobacter sp. SYSU D00382]
MKNAIYPCLWFDGNAEQAARFYCSLFKNSSLKQCTPMVTSFELEGLMFMGLNGGPMFKPNPSVSFFATVETETELRSIWNALAEGGMVLMPLDKYEWSTLYGWVQDRYGFSWQLSLGRVSDVGQAIVPLLMFCGEQQGRAEKAIAFYTSVFPESVLELVAHYAEGQTQVDASVVHARFRLNNTPFMAMDSGVAQTFTFSEGVSMVISCDTQEEIDYYWNAFTEKGQESMCGWCADEFGMWWQVVPSILGELMSDPHKAQHVAGALMKMRKLDIAALVSAG